MAKKKITLTKEDKFRSCPKCYGPIDYFNTCRTCGRAWTPELSEIEKLEMEEETREMGEEEPEPIPIGERETALRRDKEEIIGKKAKLVGTKKRDLSPIFKHWEIGDGDDETEISRKRSLMHLDSRRIYSAMGLSTKAYGNLKIVMTLLTRLWEHLDDKERETFAPTAEFLKKGLLGLAELSSKKINLAAQMEEVLTREHHKVRRIRQGKTAAQIAAKKATRMTTPGHDTEGLETADLANLDPEELMDQVRIRLDLKRKKHTKPSPNGFGEEN
jgi:hypothetical protein